MRTQTIRTAVLAGLAFPALCLAVSIHTMSGLPAPTAAYSALAGGTNQEPHSLSFIVYRVEKRPAGEFIVTFEDGQVWQQMKPDVNIELTRGENVVIRRRGATFVLESRTGLSTRVKRVH